MKHLVLLLLSLSLLNTATVMADDEKEDEKKPQSATTHPASVNDDC